jgi:transcriptional regulator with XRE-family HTH domain
MIGAAQIKAARALLGIGQRELSQIAEVAISTVKRIELTEGITGSASTLWKLQTALEKAGVEFIPADEHKGPGVRLTEKSGTKPTRGRRGTRVSSASKRRTESAT